MDDKVISQLTREFRLFHLRVLALLVFLLAVVTAAIVGLSWYLNEPLGEWLSVLLIVTGFIILLGVMLLLMGMSLAMRVHHIASEMLDEELGELRAARVRARSLQTMASTLRATLSPERVVEAALDVCGLALEEMGVPANALIGAVYLYEHEELRPIAARSLLSADFDKPLFEDGIIGESIQQAESVIISEPAHDRALKELQTFRNARVAVCIPLRISFQRFGVLLLGSEAPIELGYEQLAYFNAVADHVAIALQNAKLYQDLKAEKQRIINADEIARKELARDLHDGPTQSVAAIAMRVNFIRSLVTRDPEQAMEELSKVERLARDTSQDIRGMLFTLRPLVLETEGLAAAVWTVVNRIKEDYDIPVRFKGAETASLLDDHAQSVVFSIVEEALSNARKYSQATEIKVRLWREQGLFVAQVQDNGIGFDMESVNSSYSGRGSLGMVNMRERAERVEGSLRVESTIGMGTTVTLVVPLDKHGRQTPKPEAQTEARS
ncbi:MAG: GAF domain-containing sensor histidine kinase [Candidatus Promineifilaceae bacterium]|nr:GAF domain-containing sensor histidine kinase [Candidatus Promineifilaceae bacterium]